MDTGKDEIRRQLGFGQGQPYDMHDMVFSVRRHGIENAACGLMEERSACAGEASMPAAAVWRCVPIHGK